MYKILVCGSRDWTNKELIKEQLLKFIEKRDVVIIEGGCKGADRLAREVAIEMKIKYETYNADWNKYGKAAGPIRNSLMLKQGRPNIVIAFHNDIDNSKGTLDMINKASNENIETYLISEFEN